MRGNAGVCMLGMLLGAVMSAQGASLDSVNWFVKYGGDVDMSQATNRDGQPCFYKSNASGQSFVTFANEDMPGAADAPEAATIPGSDTKVLRLKDDRTNTYGAWSNNSPPAGHGFALRDDQSAGFTLTFRIQVLSTSGTSSSPIDAVTEMYNRMLGTDVPGADRPRDDNRFRIYQDAEGVHIFNNKVSRSVFDKVVSDGFHTIWMTSELDPGKATVTKSIWFDGEFVGSQSGLTMRTGQNRTCRVGTFSSSGTAEFLLDYIAWTDEGAIPLPEPASLGLLLVGLAGLTIRRHR